MLFSTYVPAPGRGGRLRTHREGKRDQLQYIIDSFAVPERGSWWLFSMVTLAFGSFPCR